MNALPTRGGITLVVVMIMLFSFSFHFNSSHVQGQSLQRCPDGYQRNSDGFCFPIVSTQSCPNGYLRNSEGLCLPILRSTQTCSNRYQKSMFGICEPVSNISTNYQTCPAGHQQIPPGICLSVTASQFVNPYGPTTASTDKNQTLSILSNFTNGPLQNSTNSTSPVKESSNVTNQTQPVTSIQKAPVTGSQQGLPQQQQQLSQPPPQLHPFVPPSIQQPQQQQPLVQVPPPSSQLPFNPVPMYPSGSPSYSIPYVPPLSQPTEIPPRILSDNNYVASTGNLHIVGEVINESFESMTFVKIIATFYDSNNNVIGTDFTYTSPSTLQPGQKAPFDMILIEGSMPLHLVSYYTLSVDY
jgi:hypothetical protein